jgi:hypothetical protein
LGGGPLISLFQPINTQEELLLGINRQIHSLILKKMGGKKPSIILLLSILSQLCVPTVSYDDALNAQLRDACADGDAISLEALLKEGANPNAVRVCPLAG